MDDITVKSWRKSLTKDVQWRSGDLIWMDQYKNIQIVRKNQRQKNISEIVLQNKTIVSTYKKYVFVKEYKEFKN